MHSLCDSNVWLALTLSGHAHHQTCVGWFEAQDQPDSVLFCRATQKTLLRLLTNAAVLAPYGNSALTNLQAWETWEALIDDDRISLRSDEPGGVEVLWRNFATRDTASPKLWMDAYLAAFAHAAGYLMVTTDQAFEQFDGLDLLVLA